MTLGMCTFFSIIEVLLDDHMLHEEKAATSTENHKDQSGEDPHLLHENASQLNSGGKAYAISSIANSYGNSMQCSV